MCYSVSVCTLCAVRPQRKPILLCAIKLVFVSSKRLDVTGRPTLDALASRVLLCSQSFSKNTLKSAE